MSETLTAKQILDRHYLEIRSKILDLAACLDRLDRARPDGTMLEDPRTSKLRSGIEILLSESETKRAERVQMLFSDSYEPGWLEKKLSAATTAAK